MRILTQPNLNDPNSIQRYNEDIFELIRLSSEIFNIDDIMSSNISE